MAEEVANDAFSRLIEAVQRGQVGISVDAWRNWIIRYLTENTRADIYHRDEAPLEIEFRDLLGPLQPAADESSKLLTEIDEALREVKNITSEMHRHDEETARLRLETRRLIDEMMQELNLKAA